MVCNQCKNEFGKSYKYLQFVVEKSELPQPIKAKIEMLLRSS